MFTTKKKCYLAALLFLLDILLDILGDRNLVIGTIADAIEHQFFLHGEGIGDHLTGYRTILITCNSLKQ